MKYKRKVEVFEAYEFVGGALAPGWPEGWLTVRHTFSQDGGRLMFDSPAGMQRCDMGDWLLKDARGGFTCLHAEDFRWAYEELAPEAPAGEVPVEG